MHHWLAALLAYLSRIPTIAAPNIHGRIHRILLLKEVRRLVRCSACRLHYRSSRRTSFHTMFHLSLLLVPSSPRTYTFSCWFCVPPGWWIPHAPTRRIGCMRSITMFLWADALALIHTISFSRARSPIWRLLHSSLRHGVDNPKRLLFFFLRIHPWVLNHICFILFRLELILQTSLSHVLLLDHLLLHIF